MTRYDVGIVGLGISGSCAAWQIAKAGLSVIGFDQFGAPNPLASSHGETRVIRQSYFEDPAYLPMLIRSYELWRELERDSESNLMTLNGGLYFGPHHSELVSGSIRSAELHNLPHEVLQSNELKTRFPQFNFLRDDVGVYESNAGFLMADRSVSSAIVAAQNKGAQICNEKVEAVEYSSDHCIIVANGNKFEVGQVCFCAGPWSFQILKDYKLPLKITRQYVGYIANALGSKFTQENMPIFACEAEGEMFYGVPNLNGSNGKGIKIASHALGPVLENPPVDFIANDSARQKIEVAASRILNIPNATISKIDGCCYTNTPDGHFIIDRMPGHPNVQIVAGLSGHGFKFGPFIGEVLKDRVLNRKDNLDLSLFKMNRFC